jgi:ABC-type multidrug transport system permease subunit
MLRLLNAGQREDRALAILMAGCLLMFVSSLPRLAREQFEQGGDLTQMLSYEFFLWMMVWPLLFYIIAGLVHVVTRAFTKVGTFFTTRLAIFWSFFAATPLSLLNGLTAGFVGEGQALVAVGVLWLAVIVWFFIGSLRATFQVPS